MIEKSCNLTSLGNNSLVTSDESPHAGEHQGIWAGGGGCVRDDRQIPLISDAVVINGSEIDTRDKYERDEVFERPTGMMDRLVDVIGVDDTRVFGQDGKIVVDTGFGNDEVQVTAAEDGGVNVTVNGKTRHFTAEQAKNLEIRGGSGNDNIQVAENVKVGITMRGGSGDDTIQGGGGRDLISGGSGNDTIKGGRGNDWIHGGTGNDTIKGGRGRDTIYSGSGNDDVSGGRGSDFIHGGDDEDNLRGGRGNDTLIGGDGRDRLVGSQGNDHFIRDSADYGFNPTQILESEEQITSSGGSLNLDETSGENQTSQFNNTLNSRIGVPIRTPIELPSRPPIRPPVKPPITPPGNPPVYPPVKPPIQLPLKPPIDPFGGFRSPTSALDKFYDNQKIDDTQVTRRFDGKVVINAGHGSDKINVKNADDGGLLVEVNGKNHYVSPEDAANLVIMGGSGHDNITIDPSVTVGITVLGGSGDDHIVGGSGNDRIYGGFGQDQINGGRGSDQLHGNRGNDKIAFDNQDQAVSGGSGNDSVINENGQRPTLDPLDLRHLRFRA